MLQVHVVTLFPDVCRPYFQSSILGRALRKGIFAVHYYNPIDEVSASQRVDDRQYGGGPGMVLRADPYLRCYEKTKQYEGGRKVIFLTPGGVLFTQKKAKEYVEYDHLVFFCGHYEGIDERVAEATDAERVSVGPYTLTGGTLPALLIADTVLREIPGVLGNPASCEDVRVAGQKVYTRPETLKYAGNSYTVPSVLLSGHHKKIDAHRRDVGGSAVDKDSYVL